MRSFELKARNLDGATVGSAISYTVLDESEGPRSEATQSYKEREADIRPVFGVGKRRHKIASVFIFIFQSSLSEVLFDIGQ